MKNILKKIFLFWLSVVSITGFAQTFTEKWATCLGGTEWDEAENIMQVDSSYWIVGSTESVDGDVSFNHGTYDIWLTNLNEKGELISEKTFGGSNAEGGFSTILHLNDSIFYIVSITKSVDGDISNNPWPGPLENYWVIKVNNKGDILWDRVCGGSDIDYAFNGLVTKDGGIIALGISVSFDGDITNPSGIGNYDIWMIKLGTDGQKQWELSLGGIGDETYGSIIQTFDGGFLVAGTTDGMGGGNYDTSCNFHNHGSGNNDAWVVKLDTAHNIVWQQCYGGNKDDGFANIIELPDGYILIGDTDSDDDDGDVSGYHNNPNLYNNPDIWVVKIDKTGNLLWQKCLGGFNADDAYNIFTTTDGGFMIVGSTRSSDGDVTGYHGVPGYPNYTDDIWFAKIDSTGNLLWQYCYGGVADEYIYRGVIQKSDWDYVVALGTNTTEWRCHFGQYLRPDFRIAELYDSTVGIQELKPAIQTLTVTVQPNPAYSTATFSCVLPDGIETAIFSLYSATGKQLKTALLTGNNSTYQYNCSQLKQGIYYYKVTAGNNHVSGKLVIVR